jgi:predicted PurR-regulated permease PerM
MSDPQHERDRVRLLLFYSMVLLVGYLAFNVVAPFLAALAWASVLAMVLSPIATRLDRHMSLATSATITTLTAAVLIVGPAVLVLTMLIREVTQLVVEIQQAGYSVPTPARLQEVWIELRARSPFPLPADLSSAIGDGLQALASYIVGKTGSVLQNIVGFLFQLFVVLFGLFYLLRDRDKMVNVLRQLLPFPEERRERVIHQTHELVVATAGSTFVVATVQGALTGLALGILGFRAPVFWGVMTSVFAVLPLGGSAIVWVPAAIWLFASGDGTRGIILVVFGTVVIGLADNVLRPLLLSGRTTMPGLLVFVSLMGGMAAFGFIGLVIGPVAVATMMILLEAVMPPPPAPSMPDDGRPGPTKS